MLKFWKRYPVTHLLEGCCCWVTLGSHGNYWTSPPFKYEAVSVLNTRFRFLGIRVNATVICWICIKVVTGCSVLLIEYLKLNDFLASICRAVNEERCVFVWNGHVFSSFVVRCATTACSKVTALTPFSLICPDVFVVVGLDSNVLSILAVWLRANLIEKFCKWWVGKERVVKCSSYYKLVVQLVSTGLGVQEVKTHEYNLLCLLYILRTTLA